MVFKSIKRLLAAVGLCCILSAAHAETTDITGSNADSADAATTAATAAGERESIFGDKTPTLDKSHFTWGADVGASIDMGGYDMSTFDIDIVLGYKNSLLRTLGLSAGIHRDFHTGTNFIPLMAVLRTSFIPRKTVCFFDLKAGYSFNTVGEENSGGFTFNAGIGFNLASSKRFRSHLILSYQFIHLNELQGTMVDQVKNHIDFIQLHFGVNF